MSLPRASRFPMYAGVSTPPSSKGPILGVGSRVVVTCRGTGASRVKLMDTSGTSALATVANGVEVEILAWQPRRGSETRYRVVSTKGGVEGWLGAGSLEARRPPPVPVAAVAVPSNRPTSPARAADGAARARQPRAATAAVARKTITPPPKKTGRGAR